MTGRTRERTVVGSCGIKVVARFDPQRSQKPNLAFSNRTKEIPPNREGPCARVRILQHQFYLFFLLKAYRTRGFITIAKPANKAEVLLASFNFALLKCYFLQVRNAGLLRHFFHPLGETFPGLHKIENRK